MRFCCIAGGGQLGISQLVEVSTEISRFFGTLSVFLHQELKKTKYKHDQTCLFEMLTMVFFIIHISIPIPMSRVTPFEKKETKTPKHLLIFQLRMASKEKPASMRFGRLPYINPPWLFGCGKYHSPPRTGPEKTLAVLFCQSVMTSHRISMIPS